MGGAAARGVRDGRQLAGELGTGGKSVDLDRSDRGPGSCGRRRGFGDLRLRCRARRSRPLARSVRRSGGAFAISASSKAPSIRKAMTSRCCWGKPSSSPVTSCISTKISALAAGYSSGDAGESVNSFVSSSCWSAGEDRRKHAGRHLPDPRLRLLDGFPAFVQRDHRALGDVLSLVQRRPGRHHETHQQLDVRSVERGEPVGLRLRYAEADGLALVKDRHQLGVGDFRVPVCLDARRLGPVATRGVIANHGLPRPSGQAALPGFGLRRPDTGKGHAAARRRLFAGQRMTRDGRLRLANRSVRAAQQTRNRLSEPPVWLPPHRPPIV